MVRLWGAMPEMAHRAVHWGHTQGIDVWPSFHASQPMQTVVGVFQGMAQGSAVQWCTYIVDPVPASAWVWFTEQRGGRSEHKCYGLPGARVSEVGLCLKP